MEAPKPEPIDDTTLEGIAREFIASSLGGPDSELAGIRERNLRAYNATPDGDFAPPEIDDRSTFVSSDVADTVDGLLPQLLDVFMSDDKAVECVPRKPGPQATTQAKEATGYLNHLFYTRNDGLNVLYDWIQDAALQKVGFVKVWAEEEKEDSKQTYEGQTQDQLAALLQDGATLADEPMVDETGGLTFTITDQGRRMKFCVACVAPYEMRIDPNAKWGDDPAAIGQVCHKRKFELEEMGYDLSGIGAGVPEDQGDARASLGDEQDDSSQELHESHRLYEYAELYLQLDVDGSGVAEWNQVCCINGVLVHHEKVDDHPFAEICLMPRAHAYFGDCPADRAYVIQKEQTNLSRALFDNVLFSVNQRTYVNTSASVNIDDLLDNRPGGIVRGQGLPHDAFGPIPTQALSQSAFEMQGWLGEQLQRRTGLTAYTQGMDADSLNKTAHGIEIITSKADMRLRLMTRFAAQGIRKMFGKLLKLATQHQNQQDWYDVNGQFVPVNPMEWRDQFAIKINVGLGHGTRQQQSQRVMAMLPLQMQGLQLGIVRPEQIANTIRLFAQVNEFKNPDEFADAKPSGLPTPEQFKAMLAQHQQLEQKFAEAQQQLASKDGELKLKAADLAIKREEVQIKASVAGAKVQTDQHNAARADFEAGLRGDATNNDAAEDKAIADLQEQVAGLTATIAQLLPQQPPSDSTTGTDAPAAPTGEPL
jgi:hypothetical protein